MAISFGLAKKIIEHPSYNLGLALPFVAAFYLLNDTQPITIPFMGMALGEQLSMALKIVGVTFLYIPFLIFFVIAGGLSRFSENSKLYLFFPWFVLIVSALAYLGQDGSPKYGLLFGLLSLVYLIFSRHEDGTLSLMVVGGTGALLSLFCFVSGILWFYGHPAFEPAIAALFGFTTISPEAQKVIWPMLVTLGYVLFYAVFQTSELWGGDHYRK